MEDLQLEGRRKAKERKTVIFIQVNRRQLQEVEGETEIPHLIIIACSNNYLQLSDPCTVPVGLPSQLDKELPLSSALHGWWQGGVRWGVRSGGNGDGRRRFTPSPVEDLLDTSFDWRTLEGGIRSLSNPGNHELDRVLKLSFYYFAFSNVI